MRPQGVSPGGLAIRGAPGRLGACPAALAWLCARGRSHVAAMRRADMKAAFLVCTMIAGGIAFSTGSVWAEDAKGAESITLDGGSRGSVMFPHGRHQGVLIDCKPCHDLIPKESHAVDSMKADGRLKVKAVMDMCRNCHKDMAKKGLQTGPVACGDCHKK